MPHPSQKLSLKSDGVGILLVVFLWLSIAVKILFLLYDLLQMIAPDTYTSSEIFEVYVVIRYILQLPLHIITVILFLVWMYLLHHDLKILFGTYPLTPGQSLAQLMIPFYNLWGIRNVFSTLGERLKTRGGEAMKFWLLLLYAIEFVSRALNQFLQNQSGKKETTISPALWFAALGLDLFVTIIWLEMTRLIRKSVEYRAEEIEDEKTLAANPA
jgi:hypothetical protein